MRGRISRSAPGFVAAKILKIYPYPLLYLPYHYGTGPSTHPKLSELRLPTPRLTEILLVSALEYSAEEIVTLMDEENNLRAGMHPPIPERSVSDLVEVRNQIVLTRSHLQNIASLIVPTEPGANALLHSSNAAAILILTAIRNLGLFFLRDRALESNFEHTLTKNFDIGVACNCISRS